MHLVVLVGPTAVGKTQISLEIAEWLKCPILNCDSRQLYGDLTIGTAPPSPEETARVKHYFVGCLDLHEYYSAAKYEEEALSVIESLRPSYSHAVLSGGSMMYVDAVCKGIDYMPDVLPEIREKMHRRLQQEGLDALRSELKLIDPSYYQEIDLKNPKRIVHALEIYYSSGKPFSSFRTGRIRQRPFQITKIGLQRSRQELFERINHRVDLMIEQGLLEEARRLYPMRSLNPLHTVGYNELFKYLEGTWSLEIAVEKIKKNTRVYAKKQMLWFSHDPSVRWFSPSDLPAIKQYIAEKSHQA